MHKNIERILNCKIVMGSPFCFLTSWKRINWKDIIHVIRLQRVLNRFLHNVTYAKDENLR